VGRRRQYSLLGQSLSGLSVLLWLGACAGGAADDSAAAVDPDADLDGDGYPVSVDCDDLNSEIHPDADEICDGLNNDCDAGVDEDPVDGTLWYPDADGDGFGNDGAVILSCERPPSYEALGGDCEDQQDTVYPEAPEICGDGYDNDCSPATVPCEFTDTVSEIQSQESLSGVILTWSGEEGAQLGTALSAGAWLEGGHAVVAGAPGWDLNGSGSGGFMGLSMTGGTSMGTSGASAGHEAGAALSGVGDVDGDGISDLLVGVPGANTGGTDSGQACLVLGPIGDISSLEEASVCFVGEAAHDRTGLAVSEGGDLDADGVWDLVIGSTGQGDGTEQSRGALYVVPSDLSGSVDLENAHARILGPARYDRVGASLAGPADINGDGQVDLLSGASTWNGNDEQGGLFVHLGPISGDLELTDSDVWIEGPPESALGGALLAQDMDDDGYTDLILGGPGSASSVGMGQVWLWMGPLDGPVEMDQARAELYGDDPGSELGVALAAGDLNGDETPDLAVGAPTALVSGRESGLVLVFYGPLEGTLAPQEADFTLRGQAHGDELGRSLVIDGEPSGDGRQGLWIGAPGHNDSAGMVLLAHGG
jgi:hypothetical protein